MPNGYSISTVTREVIAAIALAAALCFILVAVFSGSPVRDSRLVRPAPAFFKWGVKHLPEELRPDQFTHGRMAMYREHVSDPTRSVRQMTSGG